MAAQRECRHFAVALITKEKSLGCISDSRTQFINRASAQAARGSSLSPVHESRDVNEGANVYSEGATAEGRHTERFSLKSTECKLYLCKAPFSSAQRNPPTSGICPGSDTICIQFKVKPAGQAQIGSTFFRSLGTTSCNTGKTARFPLRWFV